LKENDMKRVAKSVWHGSGKDGHGALTTQSGTLKDTPYSFVARFGDGKGTNPEELIAAAHAGCFNMALAFALGMAGFNPDSLETQAAVSLEQVGGGWQIPAIHLDLTAKVPGITYEKFQEIANQAKATCPVSLVLKANITLNAKLAA
jgi:lipoyl-dependent peroxiredoxin